MGGTFEERVQGTIMFIRSVSERKLAEFIVHQNSGIEGLTKNNETFVEAFHNMTPNERIKQTPT